eukprot:m.47442 g.47442  ORF g.47442 m.47442 type:complete len:119 (-) comp7332_c0_seq1:1020-1376(-)
MLPLSLLKAAVNHPMLVELKSGETYNGHLSVVDNYMNLILRDVTLTSKDGDKFYKIAECYIRGNNVKYLRLPDEVIDIAIQNEKKARSNKRPKRGGGVAGRGRGRGRGGRGGYGGSKD